MNLIGHVNINIRNNVQVYSSHLTAQLQHHQYSQAQLPKQSNQDQQQQHQQDQQQAQPSQCHYSGGVDVGVNQTLKEQTTFPSQFANDYYYNTSSSATAYPSQAASPRSTCVSPGQEAGRIGGSLGLQQQQPPHQQEEQQQQQQHVPTYLSGYFSRGQPQASGEESQVKPEIEKSGINLESRYGNKSRLSKEKRPSSSTTTNNNNNNVDFEPKASSPPTSTRNTERLNFNS